MPESLEELRELAAKPMPDVLRALESRTNGLTEAEARERFVRFGPNRFKNRKRIRPFVIFLSKFKNPILLMLIGAAAVSALLQDAFDSIVIMVMVVASAVIDFINTFKSERAIQDLEAQVRITVDVSRGGREHEMPLADLVPGDVFTVVAGDLVPSDSIIIEQNDLFVNESALTGESLPAEKGTGGPDGNLLFMGTTVISGEATAIAVKTGKATRIGEIASQLVEEEPESEFEKNLKGFSFFIFRISLFLVLSIIFVNIFLRRQDPFETFLFAVAIAVGIAPELLPMIVTANLARGALKMSHHGVIVKNLAAIHNFGSIDVLCTDKTGTLTEDRIALIKYVDAHGAENKDVLFWGALSAHYVSGVRRTLDNAVREHHPFEAKGWEKVDEIPFDHERKMESVAVRHGGEYLLIAKGAPEEILRQCRRYGPKRGAFTAELLDAATNEYHVLSREGFRVLGVATKPLKPDPKGYTKADERDLAFLGFLAFMDPPKRSARETLVNMIAHNVSIKIITGDNDLVTARIAHELELPVTGVLTGEQIDLLGYQKLKEKVNEVNVFSRVNPEQKEEIVRALREKGHVVGYLGDGVNDILALKAADVGISVNNATQIAKETADIILLRRGLGEIIEGVVEGRKTFANTFKYLLMALSSNFGNMFSMPIASVVLPFLPMTPTQIILNNLLYDSSQFTIPFDNVNKEFLQKAKKFNMEFLKRFLFVFGPLSSLFDFMTFGVMWYCFGLRYQSFQTGWFLESIATQTLVVNVIRSHGGKRDRPSAILLFGSLAVAVLAWTIPYTPLGPFLGFVRFDIRLLAALAGITVLYLLVVQVTKKWFYARWGTLIDED